ncbi:cardiolipin synthase [Streptococcus caprae]|uniref:Cardiolipin synthase n=1 Tax=Streptococcus caprae TaxID=1640501 RepID=A0ABV8CVE3_9STRE
MNKKDRVVYLLSRGRFGFLRVIFSRATIIVLLIILQLMMLMASFRWLEQYHVQLDVLEIFLRIGTVLYLVNSRMNTTSKITWLLLITVFPWLGCLFLIYTKVDFGFNGLKLGMRRIIRDTQYLLKQSPEVIEELKNNHTSTYNLVNYFSRNDGHYPVYKHSRVTYFPSGEAKFAEMKEQLLKAEKYIFLEYFIIGEGIMWGEILAILEQKVKEGVEVRVMYDGMNEFSTLSFDYDERLTKLGIQAKSFGRLSPFVSTYYNYRDHRKILVIDGKVAFTGGVNLADEYINHVERFGHWKDTAIMVEGPAVDTFTVLFMQMWFHNEANPVLEGYLPETHEQFESTGYLVPYGDSPLDNDKMGENVYIDILNHARDYVYIMTPYLILDSELEHAIQFAAERGVDVRIIMPGIPDKTVPFALAKTYYPALLDAGVKIYEYTPGFIHAKVFLADDQKGVVGTINLDYRSLYHHFECGCYIYKSEVLDDIKQDFEETLAVSKEVTRDSLKSMSILTKMTGVLTKTIAPLM